MDEPKLKASLKLFAINYIGECCGNAEKSAIKAGYSENYARAQSYKLLARSDVQRYLAWLRETNSKIINIMSAQEVQEFWSKVIKDKKCKTSDRLRASELLAKAQGQFKSEW